MKKNFANIIAILTISITAIGFYLEHEKRSPTIEVKTIIEDKLTGLPVVDGLQASYKYNGNDVKSLWKLHYIISNVGNEILIGEGSKKNIIKNNISFSLGSKFKILEFNKHNSDSPFSIQIEGNDVSISFLQWRPQESFELILYAEQLEKVGIPELKTNEREIINGKVIYSSLQDINNKKSLYSTFPIYIQSILYWIAMLFYGLLIFVMPIVWLTEFIKKVKFKSWENSNFSYYKDWVETLVNNGDIQSYLSPKELPSHLWEEFEKEKPSSIPDNDFSNMTIGTIFIVVLFSIPLLLLIEI